MTVEIDRFIDKIVSESCTLMNNGLASIEELNQSLILSTESLALDIKNLLHRLSEPVPFPDISQVVQIAYGR